MTIGTKRAFLAYTILRAYTRLFLAHDNMTHSVLFAIARPSVVHLSVSQNS